jgi:iron complex outermembrane receptor protein
VRQTEGSNQTNFAIRGQTVDAFTGSATAVVPYVNDVQLNNAGAGSFYDLESIQVLKGPQGTLFGRNATGGAVLFGTTKPTNDFGGYIKGSIGNYNYREAQGALNLPIIDDKVLLRVAFDVMGRRGYQTNLVYDTKLGKARRESGRVSLTLAPNDSFKNTTVAEYSHSGGNNTTVVAFSVYQPGDLGRDGKPLVAAAAGTYNPGTFDFLGGPGTWAAYIAGNPGILKAHPNALTEGLPGYLAYRLTQPFYDAGTLELSKHDQDNIFVSNTTTFEASDNLTVKNIIGYSNDKALDIAGEIGVPYGIQYTSNLGLNQRGNDVKTRSISEEFQLQGKAFDKALNYVVGVYYQDNKQHIFYPQTYFNTAPVLANIFGPFGTGVTSDYQLKDKNIGVFAQGTYDLSNAGLDGLSITAGARYSWEKIHLQHLARSTNRLGAPPQSIKFDKPSWEFGLEYKPTQDILTYVKTRGSWRSGGLNGNAPSINAPASGGGNQFGAETVKDIEAGFKYGGRVMDRPAHFNVAVYKQWVKGVQRFETITEPGTGNSIAITVNAPKATIQGIEFDSSIKPADWLTVGASGALTDAKFSKEGVLVFGTTFVFDSYPDTPKYSGTLFAQVDLPVDESIGTMSVRGDLYAQSHQFFAAHEGTFIPGTILPSY